MVKRIDKINVKLFCFCYFISQKNSDHIFFCFVEFLLSFYICYHYCFTFIMIIIIIVSWIIRFVRVCNLVVVVVGENWIVFTFGAKIHRTYLNTHGYYYHHFVCCACKSFQQKKINSTHIKNYYPNSLSHTLYISSNIVIK